MNIGFIGNVTPPVGGAEVFLKEFLTRFVRRGNTATLIRWHRHLMRTYLPKRHVSDYAPPGATERYPRLTIHYLFNSEGPAQSNGHPLSVVDRFVEQGKEAAKIFRRHRVQLIHAHSLGNLVFAATAAKAMSVPLVLTVHGMLEFKIHDQIRIWNPELGDLAERAISKAKLVLAVSDEAAAECRERGARRVKKLSCGVDTSFFAPNGKPRTGKDFLFVGSIREDKGAGLLIEAFQHASEDLEGRLVFVGNRILDGPLVKQARQNRRIRFRGIQDARGVRSALGRAKMVILPSESEGLPLSILEAMAHKRPVLVSRTGELANVIEHGVNGFLIKHRTCKSLARQIRQVARRTDLEQVGERARETALSFDISSVIDRHLAVYESLIR